ncbi:MAG: NAD(P)-dependent alcohol dehydrogenase [Bacteroidia bacterium]
MSKYMRAAVYTKYGTADVITIKQVTKPTPKPNQVLVKIYASALNSGDVIVRSLKGNFFMKLLMRCIFGLTTPRKPVLGTTYSGVIEQVGEHVKKFKTGDEVFGLRGFKFGAHAEFLVADENSIITSKPQNRSHEEAAASVFGAQTAIYFFDKIKTKLSPKSRVLIYGATGSVGTAAMQLAKFYRTHVTAVCSDLGGELVTKLGADEVLYYNKQNIINSTKKYDVIFDAVGKKNKQYFKKMLNKNGVFLTVGGLEFASETLEQIEFLRSLLQLGKYNATIDKVFDLTQIAEAHRYVDTGRKKGNVVIKINRD